ncbi:hypothetical protein FAGKG844_30114 [Frankia sp. AgKG'84/4]
MLPITLRRTAGKTWQLYHREGWRKINPERMPLARGGVRFVIRCGTPRSASVNRCQHDYFPLASGSRWSGRRPCS